MAVYAMDFGFDKAVTIPKDRLRSETDQTCFECKRMIPAEELHYLITESVIEIGEDEQPYERPLASHTCCEQCTKLAYSFMQQGHGWAFGTLQDDIERQNNA